MHLPQHSQGQQERGQARQPRNRRDENDEPFFIRTREKRIPDRHEKEESAPAKMKSTINSAIARAASSLDFSEEFVKALLATLWETQNPKGSGSKDSGVKVQDADPVTPPTLPNIEKLNRQQVQKLEELAKKAEKTVDLKQFLAHVNALPAEAFKSKSMLDHMADFIGPIEDDDDDGVDVNFHLRDYFVLIKTGRVYEMRGGVHVFVGMLGMNEFKGMVLPEIIE